MRDPPLPVRDNVTPGTPDDSRDVGPSRQMIAVTPALVQLVSDRMAALGIRTTRDLAWRSGGELSHETVYRLLGNRLSRVRAKTLTALAGALDIDIEQLLAAAGFKNPPWVLPPEFDVVPVAVRPDLERALRTLLEAGGHMPPTR